MMSATRASGANRTSARSGGASGHNVLVIGALGLGALGLNDAVWNESFCFVISTAPITPACNSSKSAPRLADQASVRGESFFFFQAEDGIRDIGVTGVQTCALPI